MNDCNNAAPANLLPFDGEVLYYGNVMNGPEAAEYMQVLLSTIDWRNDINIIFGKKIITSRKVAWYGEKPFAYTYSHSTKEALAFTPELIALKNLTEQITGEQFNACLLNLYHHGGEGMGWHSDNEKSITPASAIASLSFGAERKFSFRHRLSKESISVMLEHGSLLLMKGTTQTHWQHSLPKSTRVTEARINLTFRHMIDQ
ncbi:alpha-ketoglutarate-dependent dioxygenase AlkB [Flavihumibacter sp. ZG627]|uniref:alpha-ketoglutarate-dependent dioxygenase AlkB family protein n=1 Tax=Flavihumibacter sp. ZG627 TaxID=1463156 RepID=UPI00057ECEBB|nr:alpha-ketoglutarate-dependent dioxygenase AlkB [Flavihumibacter sp. ZG627]KIC91924.1 DNA methylase [Flavihumibacter sp. ZG627]